MVFILFFDDMTLCSAHKPTLELPGIILISDTVFSLQAENKHSRENEECLGPQSVCFKH